MKKIAVVGDTSQDLNYDIANKYGIEILSYYIQMGDKHYKDLVDIDNKTFYSTMKDYKVLSTGVPPADDLTVLLDKVKEEGAEEVILIASSQKLTGMYNLYQAVKTYYEELKFHIFETGQIAASSALFTILAAQMRNEGKTAEEIMAEMERVKGQTKIFALFRTLKYLVQGGRFNKYKGMLGALLHIHPLLMEENGEVGVYDKVRGKKKSLKALLKVVDDYIGQAKRYRMIIFSGENESEVIELKEELKERIDKAELFLETELTPVLGVHAGPQSIGVAIMKLD